MNCPSWTRVKQHERSGDRTENVKCTNVTNRRSRGTALVNPILKSEHVLWLGSANSSPPPLKWMTRRTVLLGDRSFVYPKEWSHHKHTIGKLSSWFGVIELTSFEVRCKMLSRKPVESFLCTPTFQLIRAFRLFWYYSARCFYSPRRFFAEHPSNLTFRGLLFQRQDRSRYQRRQASIFTTKIQRFPCFVRPSPPARSESPIEHFILQEVT